MQRAFVFPGQGSQSPGMMQGLAERFKIVHTTFDEASDVLGLDLWQLVAAGPAEELNQTVITQPAMLCAGVATWRCAEELGVPAPAFMAGHSLGEYSALVAAGALDFASAVALVEFRARVMQESVADGAGAMAAVLGMADEAVVELCRRAADGQVVEAVNFNAPGQVVIAGETEAVARACELARAEGARRCLELPVSVPSHCSLMKPAAERLGERLATTELGLPQIPVVHNVDVSVSSSVAEIRAALVKQLYSPVRWVATIEHLQSEQVTSVVECGPGKVLTGLNRRIDKSLEAVALVDVASMESIRAVSSEEA